jgi:D-alanyl-D-alanine carboxypeptidase
MVPMTAGTPGARGAAALGTEGMGLRSQLHRPRLRLAALAGLLALAVVTATAGARAEGKSATLVVDANTGRVLHQSAADEPRHPASLAKMMTLYLVFELIEQGRLSPTTKIKMSANAVAAAPSKLDLEEGEEIALIDAIKVLITKSANDIAVAVAEHIAGTEEKFARLMTQKARQLGMAATTFRNASGLHDDEQVTTARDMMSLALHLIDDFPKYYPLFATKTFAYKEDTFRNHNGLLFHYPGTDGLKTGYTRASGFNLAASVRRGGKHVIGIVFGGATAATRNAAMRTYLNMGLVKASTEKTRKPAPIVPFLARANRPAESRIAGVPVPQPAERAGPKPAAAPAPAPDRGRVSGAAMTVTGSYSPAVETARVRQVLVADAPAPEPTGAASPPSIESLIDEQAAPARSAPEPATPPQRLRWVTASAFGSRAAASAPAPEPPAASHDSAEPRGAPPSTLDAQAAILDRSSAPAPPAVAAPPAPAAIARAPLPEPAASVAAGFQIQIGAYQTEAEALRQLALVRERVPTAIAGRTGVTQLVKQGDKVFYRARYGGFDAAAWATQACSELKRLKLDCIVVKAE